MIDETTGIQATAPTKSDTSPADGRAARREHEYIRNDAQCLFAALKVHHGDVLGMATKTRNRVDLIGLLDMLDAEIPAIDGQQIVATTDNLSTRGTDRSRTGSRPTSWSVQFIPDARVMANQVESHRTRIE